MEFVNINYIILHVQNLKICINIGVGRCIFLCLRFHHYYITAKSFDCPNKMAVIENAWHFFTTIEILCNIIIIF